MRAGWLFASKVLVLSFTILFSIFDLHAVQTIDVKKNNVRWVKKRTYQNGPKAKKGGETILPLILGREVEKRRDRDIFGI